MHVFFKEFFVFHSFCSSLFVFQLGVRKETGNGMLDKGGSGMDRGRGGIDNWQKYADFPYG